MNQLYLHQERGLLAMEKHRLGQLIMPTGAGKTLVMIFDAIRQFSKTQPQTVVVVCPRILLAEQLSSEFLEFITNASVAHLHSGETHHFSTTRPNVIRSWHEQTQGHKLIFTTYNSLQRLQQADISIDLILFDEAHNSVKRHFFPATEYFSHNAGRSYFFTATPKHSATISKPGMNDSSVYGQVICNIPATELVSNGTILPPKVSVQKIDTVRDKDYGAERDCMTLLDMIVNEDHMEKVLVAAPNTKVLMRMLAETEFMTEVQSYGYDVLWITAKYGAFINNKKVSREVFFDTLTEWGKDSEKKFIILHYSILSEGINCPGLTSCIMMRNMDVIQMCQTIGRVIRLDSRDSARIRAGELTSGDLQNYSKAFGMIHVPVYANTGIATSRRLQEVVDTVFVKGDAAVSVIKK